MLSLDDRTGNVLTTIALFAAVAAMAFAARVTLVVFVLALLLAYLLEPAVAWLQRRLPVKSHDRAAAIALVYLTGLAVVVGAGYALLPAIAGQMPRLEGKPPDLFDRFANREWLARHSALISDAVGRSFRALGSAASYVGWLLLVPVIAIFFLGNRAAFIDATVDLFARRRDRESVKHTVEQVDTMLAEYIRAQLLLAGLTAAFYGGSMAFLRFPYPLALGILSGALEFIPVVGWMMAAGVILTAGWLAHAPWIWMAVLIGVWRGVQNFVNSPSIMGDRLQLEPLTVIFSLMAGGQIGGLLGVVLAVPAVAVFRILWLAREDPAP